MSNSAKTLWLNHGRICPRVPQAPRALLDRFTLVGIALKHAELRSFVIERARVGAVGSGIGVVQEESASRRLPIQTLLRGSRAGLLDEVDGVPLTLDRARQFVLSGR